MSTNEIARKPYVTDVTDDEWEFLAPYLTLMDEAAPQREYPLREVFNALRWLVRTGGQWRLIPHDLPPWTAVYQQTRRWLQWGCFEAIVHDIRVVLREKAGKQPWPTAAILDSRTLRSTPESGPRAGYDGHKKINGSKVHMAVDTLGHILGLLITAADAQDRALVGALTEQIQVVTGQHVEVAYADQGYTGTAPEEAAAEHGIQLQVVRLPQAKQGFVLMPRRWVIERSFGWLARFRRLARDCERLPELLAGLHLVAFSTIMLRRFVALQAASP
jgi:transposase